MTERNEKPYLKRKSRQSGTSIKRRQSYRHETQHPSGGRLLAVPLSVEELDVLCNSFHSSGDWRMRLVDRVPRPLPSTQVLAMTNADLKTACPPILADFYKSIGQNESEVNETSETTDADASNQGLESSELASSESINDPSLSTLSKRQHRRYLELTSRHQTESRTEKQRQELKKLHNLVVHERQAYKNALHQFFQKHSHRFLIGFQDTSVPDKTTGIKTRSNEHMATSRFARMASRISQLANRPYERAKSEKSTDEKGLSLRFGNCRQVISLKLPKGPSASHLYVDALAVERLYTTDTKTWQMNGHTPNAPCSIPPPSESFVPTRYLLKDDDTAKSLAMKHNAMIITSDETLEMMLQLPGEYRTKWMTYAKMTTMSDPPKSAANIASQRTRRICILDLPISQSFSSPRECLETGYGEGIYQWLGNCRRKKDPPCNKEDTAISESVRYVYTLWKLPKLQMASSTSTGRKQVTVLIRSTIRLCDEKTGCPVKVRAHIDYFPERGKEKFSSYEMALWILDQLLLGTHGDTLPESPPSPSRHIISLVARVDPKICHVVNWESVSVAHAFNEETDFDVASFSNATKSTHRTGPMTHWHILVQLLQSIPTIDSTRQSDADYLLCLPARGLDKAAVPKMSVSVHAADVESKLDSASPTETAQRHTQGADESGTNASEATVGVHCNNKNDTIDLETEVFPNADAVQLSSDAIRFDCWRKWKWDHDDCIPYTFPAPEDEPIT